MRMGIAWIGLSNGCHRTSRVSGDSLSSVSCQVPCGPVRAFLQTCAVISMTQTPFLVTCDHLELRAFGLSRRSSRSRTEDCRAQS
jgi:hypothetical protein